MGKRTKSPYNRGVTLVEVLVSVTILALVAAPFLGSFLTAAKNNIVSDEYLTSSMYSQKVMDEIKSKGNLFESGLNDGGVVDYPNAPEGYDITYSIGLVDERKFSADENHEFDYIGENEENSVPFNLTFVIDKPEDMSSGIVTFKGTEYEIETKEFYLRVEGDGTLNPYEYEFVALDSDTHLPDIEKTGIISSNSEPYEDCVNIKVMFEKIPDSSFKLSINPDGLEGRTVYIYVIGDAGTASAFNIEGENMNNSYHIYYNLAQSPVHTDSYGIKLYRVEVCVKKNGKNVNTLVSYVKG